jgi:uncharacterized protein YdcH (DUF465 family)
MGGMIMQIEASDTSSTTAEVTRMKAELILLLTENGTLRSILKECADDLEDEITDRFRGSQNIYPDEMRRFDRDMEPVKKARAALGEKE